MTILGSQPIPHLNRSSFKSLSSDISNPIIGHLRFELPTGVFPEGSLRLYMLRIIELLSILASSFPSLSFQKFRGFDNTLYIYKIS